MTQPITVITCTGGRPELFALCRKWVCRQTVQPTRWIVTTDCDDEPFAPEGEVVPVPEDFNCVPVREEVRPLKAILFALSLVAEDSHVVVMEDDDWYGPRYIEKLLKQDSWSAFQQTMSMFHLPTQRFACSDYEVPVEGMLAFKAGNVNKVSGWLQTNPRTNIGFQPLSMLQLVQIKGAGFGLPGRKGATKKHITGHRKTNIMRRDKDYDLFRKLVGSDAESYLSLLQRQVPK